MYLTYFGLTEAPFSTTPDQRFLYLSDRHREGIAHLLYGIGERGGFVQLTGEVGTGKTTLCRYLLEHVPEQVDVALILDPTLTRNELLATLCDELQVPRGGDAPTLKSLVDAIYARLLDGHARGRRTIVIVDEAQHLTVEVLEQLRLLTNLETANAKLLQIILVGQPELLELLGRTDLRQVAQRVAARFHLTPLAPHDVRAYVRHRLAMAGQKSEIFDDRALKTVHRVTGGVPRLMNVVCDRALLGAYAARSEHVTAPIVKRAAREIAGELPGTGDRRRRTVAAATIAAGAVAVAGATAALLWWLPAVAPPSLTPTSPIAANVNAAARVAATMIAPVAPAAALAPAPPQLPAAAPASAPAATPVTAPPAAQPIGPERPLRALLADPTVVTDADTAWATIAAEWGRAYERRPFERPCDAIRRTGLDCIARRGTWTVVRRLDLPAVFELVLPDGAVHYLAVTSIDERRAILQFGGRREQVALSDLERHWDGSFIVFWRPPRPGLTMIGPAMRAQDVAWLRRELGTLDGSPVDPSARSWDQTLTARVSAFQRQNGLHPDGIAGEETLARLMALRDPATPSILRSRTGS
jgi:general secretion pathway protein A